MKEYVIPVAFDITVEDDNVTEQEAAKLLCKALASLELGGLYIGVNDDDETRIDSWWMPNHPAADGSDREAVLMWIPLLSYAGRVTENETPQQSVSKFMDIVSTWQKPQEGK